MKHFILEHVQKQSKYDKFPYIHYLSLTILKHGKSFLVQCECPNYFLHLARSSLRYDFVFMYKYVSMYL